MTNLYDLETGLNDSDPSLHAPRFRIDQLPSVWTFNISTNWIVQDLIPEGALTLLTGDSGVGKSTFALAMLGAIVHGTSFLGRTTAQGPVLYVDGENPVSVVRERLDRLHIQESSSLHIWGGWNQPTPEGPHAASVIEWARKYKGTVVYDSLIEFHSGSEQDSSETRRYFKHFRHLANLGAAVIVLHHTGKGENAKQYRGSSDIKAGVDMAYHMERVGEAESPNQPLRLKPFKCRIAATPELRFSFANGVFQLEESSPPTNRETLERVIRANPDRNNRELVSLCNAAGVSKNRAEALLIDGVRDGWIIVSPGPNRSNLYRLVEPDSSTESVS